MALKHLVSVLKRNSKAEDKGEAAVKKSYICTGKGEAWAGVWGKWEDYWLWGDRLA